MLYGKTIDHVLDLTVVLVDGTVTTLGPVADEDDLARRCARPGIEGGAYREVQAVVDAYAVEIDTRFPKVMRRVSGLFRCRSNGSGIPESGIFRS